MTDARLPSARGRIRLGDLAELYVQRTLAPSLPLPPGSAPRSYGLAPVAALSPGLFAVAVAPGEAVWLGFEALRATRPVAIRIRVNGTGSLDAITGEPWDEAGQGRLVSPPAYGLPGLRVGAGLLPFGLRAPPDAELLEELTIMAGAAEGDGQEAVVTLKLLRPAAFTRLTGENPAPLDEEAAYKGWRLP